MDKTKDGTCDCCDSREVLVVKFDRNVDLDGNPLDGYSKEDCSWWLCQLCHSTMTSQYTHNVRPGFVEMQTMCYIGNTILEKLSKPFAIMDGARIEELETKLSNQKTMVLAWLGEWRATMPEGAVRSLQTIIDCHF